jgi:hypothetical protein
MTSLVPRALTTWTAGLFREIKAVGAQRIILFPFGENARELTFSNRYGSIRFDGEIIGDLQFLGVAGGKRTPAVELTCLRYFASCVAMP